MKRIIAKLSIMMLIITAVFGAGSRVSAEEKKEVQPESANGVCTICGATGLISPD